MEKASAAETIATARKKFCNARIDDDDRMTTLDAMVRDMYVPAHADVPLSAKAMKPCRMRIVRHRMCFRIPVSPEHYALALF